MSSQFSFLGCKRITLTKRTRCSRRRFNVKTPTHSLKFLGNVEEDERMFVRKTASLFLSSSLLLRNIGEYPWYVFVDHRLQHFYWGLCKRVLDKNILGSQKNKETLSLARDAAIKAQRTFSKGKRKAFFAPRIATLNAPECVCPAKQIDQGQKMRAIVAMKKRIRGLYRT